MSTIPRLVERARSAFEDLATLGEKIADEWQYIADLRAVWLAELDRVAAAHPGREANADVEAAVERLMDEIARISDPHRAIDWLSTFPQAVLLAIEPPASPA
jgi:hypothetical protein